MQLVLKIVWNPIVMRYTVQFTSTNNFGDFVTLKRHIFMKERNMVKYKIRNAIVLIYLSIFHNPSALLHALTLLTAYIGQGEFIDKNAH